MILGSVRTNEGTVVVPCVWQARSSLERMRGLLGRTPLTLDQGLWISPCSSVHTVGMGYPLDLVYLDKNGIVRKLVRAIRPYRTSLCLGARTTLELKAGAIDHYGILTGQQLEWTTA